MREQASTFLPNIEQHHLSPCDTVSSLMCAGSSHPKGPIGATSILFLTGFDSRGGFLCQVLTLGPPQLLPPVFSRCDPQ